MKRSYLILGAAIWSITLAAAYFTGRSQTHPANEVTGTATFLQVQRPQPTHETNARQSDGVPPSENPSDANVAMASGSDALGWSLETALKQAYELTPDQARGFLFKAFALPPSDPIRSRLLNSLLRQLAQTAPLEALQLTSQIGSLRDTERAKIAILEIWATDDPSSALSWAQTALAHEPINLRNAQMRAIFRGYAESNPHAAFQSAYAMTHDTMTETRLRTELMEAVIEVQVRDGDLTSAQLAIEQLNDPETQSTLLRELVDEWAAFDPENAARYVESLGDAATTSIKTALLGEWAQNDPPAAAAWLNQLAQDDPAIARAASAIIRQWTRYDLNASAEWLNSLPDSPELDRAVAGYTYRAAQEDPATAMTWAESISNDWMRTRLMQNVAGTWQSHDPLGFGQYLESAQLDEAQKAALRDAPIGGGRRPFGR